MPSLTARLDALETDDDWTLLRQCPSCGLVVLAVEANEQFPPCTLGEPHSPVPAPGPRDIVIFGPRSEKP